MMKKFDTLLQHTAYSSRPVQSPMLGKSLKTSAQGRRSNDKGKSVEKTYPQTWGGEGGIGVLIKKLELPLFNGENLDGWIFLVERYFEINYLFSEEKFQVVVVCLEGEALMWC